MVSADKLPDERVKVVTETIVKLQDFVNSLNKLQLSSSEFAYLKTLVLFSPGKFEYFSSLSLITVHMVHVAVLLF